MDQIFGRRIHAGEPRRSVVAMRRWARVSLHQAGRPVTNAGPGRNHELRHHVWSTSPLRYECYRTIAIHQTANPGTIVVEQEVEGTSATTGSFVLPNIMVLTARHGQIAHLRDYANILAVEAATKGPVSKPCRFLHQLTSGASPTWPDACCLSDLSWSSLTDLPFPRLRGVRAQRLARSWSRSAAGEPGAA
jgi:ketosteroid isomerase-like protein